MKRKSKFVAFLLSLFATLSIGATIVTTTNSNEQEIHTMAADDVFSVIFSNSNYSYNLNLAEDGKEFEPTKIQLSITSGSLPANCTLNIGYEDAIIGNVITITRIDNLNYTIKASKAVSATLYIYMYNSSSIVIGRFPGASFNASHMNINESWQVIILDLLPWAIFVAGIIIIIIIFSKKRKIKVQKNLSDLANELLKSNTNAFEKFNKEQNEHKKKIIMLKLLALDKAKIDGIAQMADQTVSDVSADANNVLSKARIAQETINAIAKLPFEKQNVLKQYKLLFNYQKIIITDLKKEIDHFESIWNAYLKYRENIKMETRGKVDVPIQINFRTRKDYEKYLEKKSIIANNRDNNDDGNDD